ncbi:hypothetical protein ZWY2020_039792, partial [Hordeum vulgare]
WNTVRENLELNFRFTQRSLAVISLFDLAIPILLGSNIYRKFWSTGWQNNILVMAGDERVHE